MSRQLVADAVIRAVDKFSGPMTRMGSVAEKTAARMNRVTKAQTKSRRAMNRAIKPPRSVRSGPMRGGGMGKFGYAMASAAFLKNEYDVQSAMNRTQAILNVTSEKHFKKHRNLVIDLSRLYPATSSQIAKGASELAMAGMNLKQVNEVLEATVQGAMASNESIKTVGQGVTDVVMGLGKKLTRNNFLKINNVLVAGATSYAQTYTQFLDGLAKTAPLARMLGMEVERLTGMLGILADANFKGAKGGTALRTSMINAAAPTKTALAFLQKYVSAREWKSLHKSVDVFQFSGKNGAQTFSNYLADDLGINAQGLERVVRPILSNKALQQAPQKLKRKLGEVITGALNIGPGEDSAKLGSAIHRFVESGFSSLDFEGLMRLLAKRGFNENTRAMKELFGKRFVAQMDVIMASMKSGSFDNKMNDIFLPRIAGAVQRFAKILMKGLPGALKRLAGAFDGLLRAMANSGAIDTVSRVLEGLRDVINVISQTHPGILKLITLAMMGLGLMGPLGLLFGGLSGAVGSFAAVLGILAAPLLLAAGGIAGLWLAVKAMLEMKNLPFADILQTGISRIEVLAATGKKALDGLWQRFLATDVGHLIAGLFSKLPSISQIKTWGAGLWQGLSTIKFDASKGKALWAGLVAHAGTAFENIKTQAGAAWHWIGTQWARSGLQPFVDRIKAQGAALWRWMKVSVQKAATQIRAAWSKVLNMPWGAWMTKMRDGITGFIGDLGLADTAIGRFFKGLSEGLRTGWEGSELQGLVQSVMRWFKSDDAANAAETWGKRIAYALENPLKSLGKMLTGQGGLMGFLGGLWLMNTLGGAVLRFAGRVFLFLHHFGAFLLVVGEVLKRVLVPLARLGMVLGGFALAPFIGAGIAGIAAGVLALGAGVAVLIAYRGEIKSFFAGVFSGWGEKWEGSEMQWALDKMRKKIIDILNLGGDKKPADWTSYGQRFIGPVQDMLLNPVATLKAAGAALKAKFIAVHMDIMQSVLDFAKSLPQKLQAAFDFSQAFDAIGGKIGKLKLGPLIKTMFDEVSGIFSQIIEINWFDGVKAKIDVVMSQLAGMKNFLSSFSLPTWMGGGAPVQNSPADILNRAPLRFNVPLVPDYTPIPKPEVRPFSTWDAAKSGGPLPEVTAELKGKGTVNVGIKVEPSADFLARIRSMTARDDGGHIRPNVGVSNPDAAAGN